MPWAVSAPQKKLILSLARGKYRGFNDSQLAEKLRVEEGLSVSRETLRRLLRAAKLASPQKRRPSQYRSHRPPRPRFRMMALTLFGFQDDATGQILAAHVE
jgi:transposase